MPIGKNMKETVKLSLENLKKKLRIAYASIISNIKHIDKLNLAKIYNSLVVPHLLSLCPVWQFFLVNLRNYLFVEYIFVMLNSFSVTLLGPEIVT